MSIYPRSLICLMSNHCIDDDVDDVVVVDDDDDVDNDDDEVQYCSSVAILYLCIASYVLRCSTQTHYQLVLCLPSVETKYPMLFKSSSWPCITS